MPTYDPGSADVLADVTINANTYSVTAFNDNGASSNDVNFQNSNGSWKGRYGSSGEHTASMTIEISAAAEVTPTQYQTFDYRGSTWVIKQVGRSASSTSPGQLSLTLGWVSAAS